MHQAFTIFPLIVHYRALRHNNSWNNVKIKDKISDLSADFLLFFIKNSYKIFASGIYLLFSNLAKKYKTQVETIQVDFSEGRPIYDKIKQNLQDKEIGMLGKEYSKRKMFLTIT